MTTPESRKKYNREYYERHRERILNKNKIYYREIYKDIKEKKSEKFKTSDSKTSDSKTHKEYYKEYYQKNKEKARVRDAARYLKNRDVILKKCSEKFNCECGGRYNNANKKKHQRTKKHMKYLNEIKLI